MKVTRLAIALALLPAACAQTHVTGQFAMDPFANASPAAPPAPAPACGPARRGTVPFTVDALIHMEVRINGAPANLVLDTGAERSVLSPDAAKRLGVTEQYDFNRAMSGIGSTIRAGDARLRSFTLGAVELANPRILVGPVGISGADGLLGADMLGDFDLELDGPRRQLTLYDRLDCADLRPPWPGPYVTLETTRSLDRHPFFPVRVDGHELSATIDTGAQRTAMSAADAARAGVPAAALASDPVGATRGLGGGGLRAAWHEFRSFSIGGDSLHGPVLVVPGIALPRESGVVIGLDYLLSRRIWLSYGSRRIFIAHG